ncbi:DsbA family protein [Streptomyces sp. NPDC048603]|uniref:DsbA family protein n=1 Tax=Streptomyces sp. NPDC048603 TaxID=3365577 RepID=UPI00371C4124
MIRIELYADVVCAWAYIGKRRVEAALREWDGGEAEVVWRPFRIDPMAPAEAQPLAEVLQDPLVDAALQQCAPGLSAAENRLRVSEIAAAEGLGPGWGARWRASSHDAHRLISLAYDAGGAVLQDAVAEGVLRAHFVEGRDISLAATLEEVAAATGFADGGRLLSEGGAEQAVREMLLRGKAIGVTTSPTLVVAGQALVGAQAPGAIAEFLAGAAGAGARELPAEVERFRQAEALLDKGDPLGCLTLVRPLAEAHGGDPNVRLLTARAYFHSAQLNRARALLEALVADAPDDAYARLMLGRTLERQGLADEAAPHLRVAGAMVPSYGKSS